MWTEEVRFLLLVGVIGVIAAVLSWRFLPIIHANNPPRRFRDNCSGAFGLVGYFAGLLAWMLVSDGRRSPFRWAMIGMLCGIVAGNIVGRVMWAWWFKPKDGEVRA